MPPEETGVALLVTLLIGVIAIFAWRRNLIAGMVAAVGLGLVAIAWIYYINRGWPELYSDSTPSSVVYRGVDPDFALWLFIGTGASVGVGAWIASIAIPKPASRQWLHVEQSAQQLVAPILVAVSLGLTAAFGLIYGVEQVLWRSFYIPQYRVPALASVSGLLLPAGFALAVFAAAGGLPKVRRVAYLAMAVQILILAGTASRMLALLPILALIVLALIGQRVRLRWVGLAILGSLVASTMVLNFRNSPVGSHGLVPYLGGLWRSGLPDLMGGLGDVLSNVYFAVPLAAYVARTGRFTLDDLFLSLSPLPSSSAAWDLRSPQLRVHLFIPFNGIGELASISIGALFVAMGLIAGVVVVAASSLARRGRAPAALVVLVLYLMSIVLLMQYNLRSSSRFVLALLVAIVVFSALPRIRKRGRMRRAEAAKSSIDDVAR